MIKHKNVIFICFAFAMIMILSGCVKLVKVHRVVNGRKVILWVTPEKARKIRRENVQRSVKKWQQKEKAMQEQLKEQLKKEQKKIEQQEKERQKQLKEQERIKKEKKEKEKVK